MRTYLLVAAFLLGVCYKPQAQEIYNYVEQQPEFPGGQAVLNEFISENIRYPDIARMNEISGRVMVRFVVDTNGNVTDPTIFRSPHPLLSKEVIRLVGKMPKWKPGMLNGKKVYTYFSQPVLFKLEGTTPKVNFTYPYYKGDIDSALHVTDPTLEEGLVIISVIIDEKGFVRKPQIISGTSDKFAEPAINTVMALNPAAKQKEATWQSATKDEKPVPFEMHLPVYFNKK